MAAQDQQQQSQIQVMPAQGNQQYVLMSPPMMGEATTTQFEMQQGQPMLFMWTPQGLVPVAVVEMQPSPVVTSQFEPNQQSARDPAIKSAVEVPSSARQSTQTANRRSGPSQRENTGVKTAKLGDEDERPRSTEGGDTYENLQSE